MRIAYLVLTHENPRLLQRMIRVLSFGDEECAFLIHLDRKTSFEKFSSVTGRGVRFSEKRIPVYWGEFSQVEAMLSLVRQAIEDRQAYDYCLLISGSCYPLRSGGYIRRFLEANKGLEYMDILKVPAPGKPISRFDTIRYPSSAPVLRFVFRVLAKFGLAQRDHRKYLGGLEPHSGDAPCALTREACQYVLDYVCAKPHVEAYFRHTFAADEAFLHTILGNSRFRARMRRNLNYTVWPGPTNGHPAMIRHQDVAFFEAQDQVCRTDIYGPGELLFARKLNDDLMDIVDRIDAMIERKEHISLSVGNEVFKRANHNELAKLDL